MKGTITVQESAKLQELETIIDRGVKTFVEVGESLAVIRDLRLYRSDYPTFEEYCRERWGMSRAYCNRLIQSADVVKTLAPTGAIIKTERQARELARIPPEMREQIIHRATADNGTLTAKSIREASKKNDETELCIVESTVDEATIKKWRPSMAIEFFFQARNFMDKISTNDTDRVEALNRMIEYCQKRLTSNK
jgi:hypothetical protein